ncbi:MAG TPA: hypothetical protein VN408_30725 [Actinoplanes sp.]|nr:hypothetical protein [Actinoplanes sp.]
MSGERSDDFVTAQSQLIEEYSASPNAGPIAVGRVIVPTDGADRRTRKRYQEYARSRHDRTLKPHGERRTLFAPDLVGTATEIVERLHTDPVTAAASALRLELPYEFDREEYEQILADAVTLIGPQLGWSPAGVR